MPRPARRRLRRLALVSGIVLALLVVLLASGAVFQAYAEGRDRDRFPAPGRLVDVGGRALHLHITGPPDAAGPTVVLESGMGPAYSDAWAWVQRDLSRFARVVSYDRPGLGWSDPHEHGEDPVALAEDLRGALLASGVPGPYLVVGHSLGAFHARVFAARNPDEVVGLVLLDPSHEDQWDRLPREVLDAQRPYETLLGVLPHAARVGVVRVVNPLGDAAQTLPVDVRDRALANFDRVDHLQATTTEYRNFEVVGDVAATGASTFGDLPVLVVSAGEEPGMPAIVEPKQALHRELAATLSTQGRWVSVADSDHVSLVAAPDDAAQTADLVAEAWRARGAG